MSNTTPTSLVEDSSKVQTEDVLKAYLCGSISEETGRNHFVSQFGTSEHFDRFLTSIKAGKEYSNYIKGINPFLLLSDGRKRKMGRNWTQEEDMRLMTAVKIHGTNKWIQIAEMVGGGRTRSQCSQRWNRGLNPLIFKGPWTLEEEKQLLAMVAQYGLKSWKRIATEMSNRSDVQCRYHYSQIQKHGLSKSKEEEANESPKPDFSKKIMPDPENEVFGISIFNDIQTEPSLWPLTRNIETENDIQFENIEHSFFNEF